MDSPRQLAFIDATLAQPVAHHLTSYHYGLYPAKALSQHSEMLPFTEKARRVLGALFDKHLVSYAFEHHYHVFKATKALLHNQAVGNSNNTAGVTYLGDGAWGIDHNGQGKLEWYDELQLNYKHVFYGALSVDAGNVRLTISAADEKQNVFFTTSKTKSFKS
jgi:hypothetical protein